MERLLSLHSTVMILLPREISGAFLCVKREKILVSSGCNFTPVRKLME